MAAILLTPLILVACNQDKIDNLSKETEQLASEKTRLNQQLEDYMRTFNEIESNLAKIKEREEKINLKTRDNVEYREDTKTAIVKDIQAINDLMIENSNKMNRLQSQLSNTNAEFKKMVANLNSRIEDRNKQIVVMKSELQQLNFEKSELAKTVNNLEVSVDTLLNKTNFQRLVINTQSVEIEEKDKLINTGFVAIGSSKELLDSKVIDKEGGILGLGSTETLKSNLNEDAFSKININEITAIPVTARKAELITPHPTDSYELALNENNEIGQLMILDPSKFWHSSKYVVVKLY